jgi:hypothetical protein
MFTLNRGDLELVWNVVKTNTSVWIRRGIVTGLGTWWELWPSAEGSTWPTYVLFSNFQLLRIFPMDRTQVQVESTKLLIEPVKMSP